MTTTQFRNFDMYSHRITQIVRASGPVPMKLLAAAIVANQADGFEYVTKVMIAAAARLDAEAAGESGEDRECYSEAARYITERFMIFRVLLYKKIQNAWF